MGNDKVKITKPDPERMDLLRSLPVEIKEQITGEEAAAFLNGEDPPKSLLEKLDAYLVNETSEEESKAGEEKKQCPTCMGQKIIPGTCETSQEWQGADDTGDLDSQYTPDEPCPTCDGKGYIVE